MLPSTMTWLESTDTAVIDRCLCNTGHSHHRWRRHPQGLPFLMCQRLLLVAGGGRECLFLSWCSGWGIGEEKRKERKGAPEHNRGKYYNICETGGGGGQRPSLDE